MPLLRARVAIVRIVVAVAAGLLVAVLSTAPVASGDPSDPAPADDPTSCNEPSCVPGIMPGAVLGAPCQQTTYYVFGVTDWGRVVFCGSPRRKAPRWFRSTELRGVKLEGGNCSTRDGEMAQAPDGLFLTCNTSNGASTWTRGDL